MGCDIGQGFFLARPMPKPSLIALLERRAVPHQAS
jgi:EAL domain-containing protein (putative c-di-GMP-specific phosphodiesterase class I)